MKEINKQEDRMSATVNNDPIYASEVEGYKALLEYSINSNLGMQNELNSKERQEYIDKYSRTNEEILKVLARVKVINQNAIKSGIEVSENDIYNTAKQEVSLMKTTDLEFFNITLEAYQLNEEDYIKKIHMPNVRNMFLRSQLKENCFENKDVSDKEKVIQEYEEYIDGLVKKVDIRYK